MGKWFLDNLVGFVATAVSVVAFFKSRHAETLAAELTKRQIEQIDASEAEKQKVKIRYSLSSTGRGTKSLVIQNVGEVTAFNLECDISSGDGQKARSSSLSRFPIKEFLPNSNAAVLMALTMGTPLDYYVTTKWTTAEGKAEEYREYVTFGG